MKPGSSALSRSEYAALSRFLRGYLHQDAAVEYGSAEAAAHRFRKDADERETAIVHSELEHLLSENEGVPISGLAKALEALGSSWRFQSREEVEVLLKALK